MVYKAVDCIVLTVFDKAETQHIHRWVEFCNKLNLSTCMELAEYELIAWVLHEGTGLNSDLPLMANQKAQLQQLTDGERK